MTTAEPSKACSACKDIKPLAAYSLDKTHKDGHKYVCKPCDSEHKKAYRRANPEKMRASFLAYYTNNRDKCIASTLRWQENNPDKVSVKGARYRANSPEKHRARGVVYRAKNPDKIAAKNAAYLVNNRDKCNAVNARYRASKLQATPVWANHAEIAKVYKLADMLTALHGVPYHVDHIYPLQGRYVSGFHTHQNLQVLPSNVNQSKSNRVRPDIIGVTPL